MRVAIVGAGAIARAHAEALASLPGCHLAAVADTDPDAARRLAKPAGAAAFSRAEQLFAEADAGAVIVCTPPATHESVVTAAMRAGVPTLCEKPFAPTLAAAKRMARAAESTGTLLTLASKFRFAEGVVAAKSLIDSGELGDIGLAEIVFTAKLDMAGRWQSNPAISGGGVVTDNAPHAADLVRFLFGDIESVSATELAPRRLAVEESATLAFRTRIGVTATALLSWASDVRRLWFLTIHGSAGSVEVGWGEARARFGTGDWHRLAGGYSKHACFVALVADFLAAARGEAAPALPLADALAAVAAIEAATRSLAAPNWSELPAPREVDRARH